MKLPIFLAALLTAFLLCFSSLRAKNKAPSWEERARTAKADYIFLEAGRQSLLGNNDAYYALLQESNRLNPADKYVAGELGLQRILMTAPDDTAAIRKGLSMMRAYFDAHPEDEAQAKLYARVCRAVGNGAEVLRVNTILRALYPDKQEYTLGVASLLFNSVDPAMRAAGLAMYDSIEAAEGKNPQITSTKLERFIEEGDTAKVLREIAELTAAYPKNVNIIAFSGDVLLSLGRREDARRAYIHACETDSTEGYPFYALANFYEVEGDTAGYNREILNALRKKSLDLDTKLKILKSFITKEIERNDLPPMDSVGAADSLYSAAVPDTVPANSDDMDGEESPLSLTPRQAAVIDSLFRVVQEDHMLEPEFYNAYAEYLMSMLDYEGAAEQLGQSLSIDPAHERRWVQLVLIDARLNETQDVDVDAHRAMSYFPQSPVFPRILSTAYFQQERYDEALTQMQRALELTDTAKTDELAELHQTIGDMLSFMNRHAEAMEEYERALALDPANAMTLNNYAYLMAQQDRDLPRALEMIQRATSLRPDDPTLLDTYAWVLFKMKRYADALDLINDTFKHMTPAAAANAEFYDHAGDIYFMNGDRDKALEYWKKASELDPESELIRRKVRHKTIFFE